MRHCISLGYGRFAEDAAGSDDLRRQLRDRDRARDRRIREQRDHCWKERSGAKNPAKDRDYQCTLLIKRWLAGE